jgi:hypothetical protein
VRFLCLTDKKARGVEKWESKCSLCTFESLVNSSKVAEAWLKHFKTPSIISMIEKGSIEQFVKSFYEGIDVDRGG